MDGRVQNPAVGSGFLDYLRDGNRSRYEDLLLSRRAKLARLVSGELLEGRGRFLAAIADGVWLASVLLHATTGDGSTCTASPSYARAEGRRPAGSRELPFLLEDYRFSAVTCRSARC